MNTQKERSHAREETGAELWVKWALSNSIGMLVAKNVAGTTVKIKIIKRHFSGPQNIRREFAVNGIFEHKFNISRRLKYYGMRTE
jgi:hypothetical protein